MGGGAQGGFWGIWVYHILIRVLYTDAFVNTHQAAHLGCVQFSKCTLYNKISLCKDISIVVELFFGLLEIAVKLL